MKKPLVLLIIFTFSLIFSFSVVLAEDKKYTNELVFTHTLQLSKSINNVNAAKAAEYVNGYILEPGAIFSYNLVVGKRTWARGFRYGYMPITDKKGHIIKEIKVVGSGVCRFSTAMFQAARAFDLEIIENHSHSFGVDYAKKGDDATVNWGNGPGSKGWLDNVFKNTKDYSILIKCSVNKKNLVTVQFYKINESEK